MAAAPPFDVVPVIDLRERQAVRAIAGRRKHYRPLQTPLAQSSDPLDVARGLRSLYPFPRLYVADLDAIAGFGPSFALFEELQHHEPDLCLWVDSGARTHAETALLLARARVSAVIGSETGIEPGEVSALSHAFPGRIILSLDFNAAGFIGEPALRHHPECWPDTVIAMTLARVGGAQGPDCPCLATLKAMKPAAAFYAAGGVRDRTDIEHLQQAGAAGALVATALHDGTIMAGDLIEITGR